MQRALSIQEQLKQINILYIALLTGQLSAAIILFLIKIENTSSSQDGALGGSLLPALIAFFCVMSIAMAFLIFNKRKESGRNLTGNLEEKLSHYRQSFTIRAAMIEGPNLLVLISYFFIERNYVYLFLFAIGIGVFIMIRPSIDRLVEDYQLSASEQSELRNSLK